MFRPLVLAIFFLSTISCLAANSIKYNTVFGPALAPYFKLERHIEKEVALGKVVGTGVAIVENGRLTFNKAFGHLKKGEHAKVTTDTIFQIGSSTKPMTATLFLVAQKQKKINFSTPIILPAAKPITLEARHILSHTSGFRRQGWNWQIEHGASRAQLLGLFANKVNHGIGKDFDYHNVAFSLIEEPLAKAFNIPFNEAMEQHLFKPLEMKRTSIGFKNFEKLSNRAWPHEHGKSGSYVPADNYSSHYHESVVSSAGVNSSISDMAQFLLLQLGALPKIASSKELSALHSPVCLAPDAERWFKNRLQEKFSCHYGYGWRVLKTAHNTIVFHGGWLKGFASIMAFSPHQKKGIVILSNTESPFAFSTAMDFMLTNNN